MRSERWVRYPVGANIREPTPLRAHGVGRAFLYFRLELRVFATLIANVFDFDILRAPRPQGHNRIWLGSEIAFALDERDDALGVRVVGLDGLVRLEQQRMGELEIARQHDVPVVLRAEEVGDGASASAAPGQCGSQGAAGTKWSPRLDDICLVSVHGPRRCHPPHRQFDKSSASDYF